ncbi:hypothetical protein [Streptacidiphilus anmyonensis]|nr:hypothetical protein [Streptacidiphilus anmyonensis]
MNEFEPLDLIADSIEDKAIVAGLNENDCSACGPAGCLACVVISCF